MVNPFHVKLQVSLGDGDPVSLIVSIIMCCAPSFKASRRASSRILRRPTAGKIMLHVEVLEMRVVRQDFLEQGPQLGMSHWPSPVDRRAGRWYPRARPGRPCKRPGSPLARSGSCRAPARAADVLMTASATRGPCELLGAGLEQVYVHQRQHRPVNLIVGGFIGTHPHRPPMAASVFGLQLLGDQIVYHIEHQL